MKLPILLILAIAFLCFSILWTPARTPEYWLVTIQYQKTPASVIQWSFWTAGTLTETYRNLLRCDSYPGCTIVGAWKVTKADYDRAIAELPTNTICKAL